MASAASPHGAQLKERVVFVGIGGATCSGKTTLAKHLKRILPGSEIIHQDDFAPPQELVPIHPVYGVQDWDAPRGAIDWPRMAKFLQHAKTSGGEFMEGHYSHDHLNEQKDMPIPPETFTHWRSVFQEIERVHRAKGERIIWRLVDGFLLYWNKEVVASLDIRIFLRVPQNILAKRRHERHGYHTAVQSDMAEGSLWRDPPGYWEQIVWPAYVEAHSRIFTDGDLENGAPATPADEPPAEDGAPVRNLIVLDSLRVSMGDVVTRVCEVLRDTSSS